MPESRQRVGYGNKIDFDVHGRNATLRGAEPASRNLPEALSTIYTTHYRHVLRICRRFFRQPEDTGDAAAEVFLKLHKVLETRDEALPFRPWVSKVTGRHCIHKVRQRKREKGACVDGTDLLEVPDHSTPSPPSQVLRREEQLEVGEQLIRLPGRWKVPLELRYYNI